ncbi:MAG: hypothetical protein FWH06_02355 [Oscillospiraceae bacterium]|nr:hypothetical protein [Oscillospiraceae bacterium]
MSRKSKAPRCERGEGGQSGPNPEPKGAKENFYDKIPLTAKQLDVVIVILIAALVAALTLGVLIGNGVISGPRF